MQNIDDHDKHVVDTAILVEDLSIWTKLSSEKLSEKIATRREINLELLRKLKNYTLKSSCGIIEGRRYCANAERQLQLLRSFQELDPRFQIKAYFDEVAKKSDAAYFARDPLVAILQK